MNSTPPPVTSESRDESTSGVKGQHLQPWTALFLAIITVFGVALYLRAKFPRLSQEDALVSNLGVFLSINFSIIAVMIAGFVVVKNLFRLFLDRRRGILGARLRSRLVAAFVGLSLIPTVLLFFVAKDIVGSAMQEWFSPQVVSSVNGALEVGRQYYSEAEEHMLLEAKSVSSELELLFPGRFAGMTDEDFLLQQPGREVLESFLRRKLEEYGLLELAIVDQSGTVVLTAVGEQALKREIHVSPVHLTSLRRAFSGGFTIRPEQSIDAEFIRGYAPIAKVTNDAELVREPEGESDQEGTLVAHWSQPPATGAIRQYAVVATALTSDTLADALSSLVDSYDQYRLLSSNRQPLASSYLATLVAFTLLIIFVAIWVGFYLAKGLAVPIGLLARGTEQVAHGNLDYHIPEIGDDELSVLVRSFNLMTRDLKEINGELVSRRRYMEVVLENAGVGVISIDTAEKVTTFNRAAGEMLGGNPASMVGEALSTALPATLYHQLRELIQRMAEGNEVATAETLTFEHEGAAKHVQVSVTRLQEERHELLGYVILLDDLTELVNAQRLVAWREVARRIAHEIKNPLTPIQLNAQRIQRRMRDQLRPLQDGAQTEQEEERLLVIDATEVIVRQVEILRNLVNEFSRFARLPKCTPRMANLNKVLTDTVTMYREIHPDIDYRVTLDEKLPEFAFDPEHIGRACTNLLDNAISSIRESSTGKNDAMLGTVEVESRWNEKFDTAVVRISDSGKGIAEHERPKLFEPYFSTRKGGTGLGLAIVSAIIADHNGYIRYRDNEPRGATFILELPIQGAGSRRQSVG